MRKVIFTFGGGLRKGRRGRWCSTDFTGPGLASHLRILACGNLYRKNPESRVIISGGRGYLSGKNEPAPALVMASELKKLGVPAKSILSDRVSKNTHAQILKLKVLLLKYGYTRVIVTSNRYHLGRIRAFMLEDDFLKQLLANKMIRLVASERVILAERPELRSKINKLYKSVKMKKIIASEKNGILQIKNGTYRN